MSVPPPPELSVLIASHNRRELLRRCLESLRAQTAAPSSFEAIVADDGSTDGTAEMVEALEAPFELRPVRLAQAGKAAALNAILPLARGAACLFLDDDVVALPDLVAEHLAAQREGGRAVAIGRLIQEPPEADDPFAHAAAEAWNERYEELAGRQADWADCYGGNFSAPREALLEVGGFATDLRAVEDLELGYRLCRAGCAPRYLQRAGAIHDDQKPGRRILGHMWRYGAVCVELASRHPETRSRLLGWYREPTLREVALRHSLLAMRLPPRVLAAAGRLVPGNARRRVWFGFVSRHAFWRGVRDAMDRKEWRQTTRRVPVLVYHSFTADNEGSEFVVTKRAFARQMRVLAALGYRTISFEQLARALREGRPPPRRAVAITIDDGYRDNLEVALPVLRSRGFTATIFLVSGRLGGRNEWHGESTEDRPMLSLGEVREMRRAGIEVGAHSRTHPSLPEVEDGEALRDEVAGSRLELEASIDAPVPTFAYPYGRYDRRVVAATREAGFTGACTTFSRPARWGDDPLLVPRIEIEGTDSLARFLRKLWLGEEPAAAD